MPQEPPRRAKPGAPRQYFVPAPEGSPEKRSASRAPGKDQVRPPVQPAPNKPAAPRPQQPQQQPLPTQPATAPESPRRRSRRRWLLLIPLVIVALLGSMLWWANSIYGRIEKIDLEGVLDPITGEGTNYLLVGSDSREDLDPEEGSGVQGRRADTIIVLRITDSGALMMSIPRDLWVENAATGENGRINGAYNAGPANLVRTVQQNLDIPINHYLEVGFGSFVGLVDAIGGVTIEFPNPAFDQASGLFVTESGPVVLDGPQALAYARSRHYTEVIGGREVLEPTADLGRQQRQQLFLRSALSEVGATRNPLTLVRVADAMSSELKIDSGLGMGEAFTLVRRLGSSDMETVLLPVDGVRKGQAAVLVLSEPEAQEALARFR